MAEQFDPMQLVELEEELYQQKQARRIEETVSLPIRIIDWFVAHIREPEQVPFKKYVILALTCGWLCGAHRFYAKQYITGMLYLLFCWTGLPLAMAVVDVFVVCLKHPVDENGMITL